MSIIDGLKYRIVSSIEFEFLKILWFKFRLRFCLDVVIEEILRFFKLCFWFKSFLPIMSQVILFFFQNNIFEYSAYLNLHGDAG